MNKEKRVERLTARIAKLKEKNAAEEKEMRTKRIERLEARLAELQAA